MQRDYCERVESSSIEMRLLHWNAMQRHYCEEFHNHYWILPLHWNVSSSPSPQCTGTTEHSVKKLLQRRSKCSSAFQGGKMQALNRHPNFHHNEEFQSLTREGCCILHKLQQSLCQINSTPNLIQNGRVWKNIDFSGEGKLRTVWDASKPVNLKSLTCRPVCPPPPLSSSP